MATLAPQIHAGESAVVERSDTGPLIACRDCGRSYPTVDGPAMLFALKGSCPDCGGGFELVL